MSVPQSLMGLGDREKILLAKRMLLVADATHEHPVQLRAFARWRKGVASEAESLRAHLREHLPAHMIPSEIVSIESWPRLPNGKIDRAALLFSTAKMETTSRPSASPPSNTDPVTATLVDIWQTLLGREAIGIHDNFFSLGGHSLLAMQMISLVRTRLGIILPLRRLFDEPTIAQLAAFARQSQVAADVDGNQATDMEDGVI